MTDSWGENDKPAAQAAGGESWGEGDKEVNPQSTDGALVRGFKKAGHALNVGANLYAQDAGGAADALKAQREYELANPANKEGEELMQAYQEAPDDSFWKGVGAMGGEVAKDWREARGLGAKAKSVGKNIVGAGALLGEQIGNMAAPMAGMGMGSVAGGAAGAAVGGAAAPVTGAVGSVVGGIAGGSLGNALQEAGFKSMEEVQKAGIDLGDVQAVEKYLQEHGDAVRQGAAIKGTVLATVDRLTLGIGGKILRKPLEMATERALVKMGVNLTDKAAVAAAKKNAKQEIASHIAADAAYQAANKGVQKYARNAAAFAVDPAGEFAGEYLGSGLGFGEWSTKEAGLEALMGLGQSGAMYAGHKAYGAVTSPLRGQQAAAAPEQVPAAEGDGYAAQIPTEQPPAPYIDEARMEAQGLRQYPAPILDEQRIAQRLADGPHGEDLGAFEWNPSTAPGATEQAGDGIDFTRDFDTSGLELEPPISQQMGLRTAQDGGGALESAAALAVDGGASPAAAEFIASTGRELTPLGQAAQLDGDVIDVEAREVGPAPELGMTRRIAQDDGAGQQASPRQQAALPAPTNLREGLERIRQQRAEAARMAGQADIQETAAPAAPTKGKSNGPQTNQAEQAKAQQPETGIAPQATGTSQSPTARVSDQGGGRGLQAAGVGGQDSAIEQAAKGQAQFSKREFAEGWIAQHGLGDSHRVVKQRNGNFRVEANPPAAEESAGAAPLKVGTTPGNAEAVTVRDGVVHIGDEQAYDYNSGEPVRAPQDATNAQLAQALRDAEAVTNQQRFYGLEKAKTEPVSPQEQLQALEAKMMAKAGVDNIEAAMKSKKVSVAHKGQRNRLLKQVGPVAQQEQAAPKQAAPMHQEAGQAPEAATASVIGESMREAAGNRDTTPAQMRQWLMGEIEGAVSRAQEAGRVKAGQADGFVRFDVPGDGKFKVANSAAHLESFRKRVSASAGFRGEGTAHKPASEVRDFGVQSGSGTQASAINNMIEEGDFEAAKQYAEAVGVALEDVKPRTKEQRAQWAQFLSDGAQPQATGSERGANGEQTGTSPQAVPIKQQVREVFSREYEALYGFKRDSQVENNPMVSDLARAIEGKDAEILRELNIGDAKMNPVLRKAFSEVTGIQLPAGKAASLDAVDKWAGVTPEQRAQKELERKATIKHNGLRRDAEAARKDAARVNVSRDDGSAMDGAAYVLDLFERGYTNVVARGSVTHMVDDKGAGFTMPRQAPALAKYAKSLAAYVESGGKPGDLISAMEQIEAINREGAGANLKSAPIGETSEKEGANLRTDTAPAGPTKEVQRDSSGNVIRRPQRTGPSRYANPHPQPGDTPAITRAKSNVTAYMNGDIDRATMMQRLEDSGEPEGVIHSITQRLGDDSPSKGEVKAMMERRTAKAEPPKTQLAPGTRVNGPQERAAADRLEKLLGQMDVITQRNTREGAAKRIVRDLAEELRKPSTVSGVKGLLNQASSHLMRSHPAMAQVLDEVNDSLALADGEHVESLPERKAAQKGSSSANQNLMQAAKDSGKPAPKKKPNADQVRAKADLMSALADLGDILGKSTRLSIMPEQEQKLLPVLTRLLDAAFRLGYHKFKDSAKYALDQIREHVGTEAADALTLDHLQGAYIAMAGGKQGADSKRTVIDVETKAEIEAHAISVEDEVEGANIGEHTPQTREDNHGNPEQAGRAANQGRAPEVSGRGGRDNDAAAPADSGDLESRQPQDVPAPTDAGRTGGDGVRVPAADVGRAGPANQGGDASDGRTRAGRATAPDAGTREKPSVKAPEAVSPANPGPGNFHIENPLDIVGGTPVVRFDKNMAAIELLNELRESERQATAEEQRTLAGYTGWGSFGQELFQGTWDRPMPKAGWEKRDQWLRDHLGKDEWESAQRSITNAHYTDPPTVMAMWDMAKRMGFTGGRVLEPSMGIGNFFGMMPADIKGRSQLAGIELDSLTGSMAKRLYPNANIKVMGYQESKTPDNFYDVVIGNWPFENTVIADRRYNTLSPFLHDYFFLKALDQVRPGGLVIGITSNGTMDKKATRIRAALARKAELVTAIRLPSGAFQEYAGTKVVTDIVILKKRDKALSLTPNDPWINSVAYKTPSGQEVFINEFYANNIGNVIGITDYGHGTTRMQPGMIVHRPENMAERLRDAVNLVPEGVFTKESRAEHISYVTNHTADREGSLSEQDGKLYVVRGEHLAPAHDVRKYALKSEQATAKREQELRALIDMRRKYASLIEAERSGSADEARKALRDAFGAFKKEHGALGDSFGLDYLRKIDDPFYPALAALEVDGKPSDILTRSTMRGTRSIENPTPQDAYVLARNRSVQPSLAEIAEIAGKSEEVVRNALVKSGAVFEAPNGDVVPSDIYLSGNVRQKLREAQAALADGNQAMQRNVDELKKVLPEDVPYFNIESQLGATWVPAKTYADYVAHMLNRPNADGIEATFLNGRWKIRLPNGANHWTEARTGFGTGEYPFTKLVNAAFTNQTVKIRRKDSDGAEYVDTEATDEANARIADIRTKFAEWLWSDPERRAALEAEYNESRNAYSTPKYDGSFLSFEGMALSLGRGPFNLREHQVNAIWRALVNRRSLNAHEVGTGKTFTMGGIAVESRRYGIAKKPVLLAHNANSASVAAEIQQMYPAAKVLYINNLDKDSIAVRMRQIANDDWDAIVMPHSLIDRLSFREETLMEMAREDIRSLEEEAYAAAEEDGVSLTAKIMDDEGEMKKVRSITAKELVKARNRIIETIKKQAMQSSREGAVPFEDLGIDMVLVDEAHEFKKPPISTRMNMKGLNTQTSNRSIALQFITRYIRANNFGGNVHTFTGTPITNTLTEIFHQMRYVMEDEMKAAGVDSWDGWFGSFAKEVQDVELSAAGEYEAVNRLAGFINVPELRRMIGQYMDVVFAEDMPEMQPRKVNGKVLTSTDLTEAERAELLNGRTDGALDRPYKKVVNVTSDLTDEQSRIFAELQGYARTWRNMQGKARMEAMRNGSPESPIITEGLANKASFDVRLMEDERHAGQEGNVPDDPGSKASKVVANVLEIYQSDDRTAQVIFAEQGFSTSKDKSMGRDPSGKKITRRAKTFSTMRDIVERLVQGGIPREQIAIVDGSVSKEKRKEIADAMNELRVRVVIGSTDTLGVGVNMQRNLRAMHHMDAPYMPGELEQRNGRGLRQGNQWNTVMEYRYMTDRLDGRRWQILAVKQRFITAFMKANSDNRVIEGDAASDEESDIVQSFSEAAGDPRILIRAKLRKNVEALQRAERMHGNGIADARRNIRNTKEAIEWNRGELRKMKANDLPQRLRSMMQAQSESFSATVQGTRYDTRKDAEEAIDQFLRNEMRMEQTGVKVATYRDQAITARWPSHASKPELVMDVDGQEFSSGSLRGLEQQIRNYPGRIDKVEANIAEREASIERLEQVSNTPFARAADLDAAQQRLAALERDIEVNPVPPPAWLRTGAPVDSEAYRDGNPFVVTGHRWTQDGWFVLGQDAKGEMAIPYAEVKDAQGMPLYEEREFQAPEVIEKEDKAAAATGEAANFAANPTKRPGTAQDKAVMQAIADGKSARDVLRLIANGSKDPFLRQVARLLLKAGITPNIQFGHIGKTEKGDPIHGQYRGKTDTIAIAGSAEYAAERIFMHEAMHAATMRALKKPGLHSLQLKKLFEHVSKQQSLAGFYGIKSVDEFVAEVFTNPDFRRALRNVNAPSGSTLKTAWDGFVRILRSILGLNNDAHSALSQALNLGVGAVREDMLIRKRGGQAAGTMNMATELDTAEAQRQFAETERAYGGRAAYDKAKADGKTKLNYGQWVQVRTPNFKAWFGDWEAVRAQQRLDAMQPLQVRVPDEWRGLGHAELRQKMAEELDRMVREQVKIEHPELGEIRVGRVGAKKSEGSARDPAKSLVAADIEALIPASVYARSAPSRGGDGPDISGYSTLLAHVQVDDVPLVASFTVRHQSDGKWYYNAVALHDAKEKAQDSYERPDQQAGSSVAPIAGLSEFIRRPLARVNPDEVSKVVDHATGEPLVVYHSTREPFTEMREKYGGLYTSDTGGVAANIFADDFDEGVMELFVSAKNPFDMRWKNMTDEAKNVLREVVSSVVDEEDQADAAGRADVAFEDADPFEVFTDGEGYMFYGRNVQNRIVEGLKAKGFDAVVMPDALAWGDENVSTVVFTPTQIKSATGNNGNFDPNDPDIANFGTDDIGRNMGNGLKSITVPNVKRLGKHKLTDWLKHGLPFLGRRQLVDVYGDVLPLAEYDRLAAQMEADKNESGAGADELVRAWAKLPDEKKLADLMHEATLAQIDADSEVAYADGDDRAQSTMLKGRFKALTPEAQEVYRKARDGYRAHHEQVRKAIRERIMRSELTHAKRHELLTKMDDDFFQKVKGVYFPLARFGKYVTVVKDGQGQVVSVSRAETMGEAEAGRAALLKAFPKDKDFSVSRVTLDKDFVASHQMVGRGFMTELYSALQGSGIENAQLAELEDTLGQLYLSSLPDLSWAKHGIHRKGTPGFSQDARRAFAQNTFHGARYLAKLRYGDLMQDELDGMQSHVDEWSEIEDFDQPAAQRVVDEMRKRHDAVMNPQSSPLSTALTSFGFVYYLGLSPAAAVVNLSQTALVAYPIMAAKWGYGKTSAALLQASKEAMAGKNDMRTQLKKAEEIDAYDKAVNAGVIDVTQAHDLAGIAQGEDQRAAWKLRPVMRAASFLFHHAEKFNRQATFIAAFRLARDAKANPAEAYEQAVKATYDGHFDYSASNRPRVMMGNTARVVLLFKQFAQNMIYTMARQAYQSVAGKSPEERRQARKVFAGLMTTHAMAAGVLGLPLVGPLLAVASMLGSDDDEPWNAEVALRNMLADAVGPKASEVMARGMSRLTPWDISGRVGLDNLIFPDVREGLEGQRWAETFATGMLGPVVGIGVNAAKAAQKMGDGDYGRALEDLLPIALRNPIKAMRFYEEGAQDLSGISIKDEVGMAGVLGQAAGFSPSEVRLAQEGKTAVLDADRRINERRSELMGKFAKAAMAKDSQAMEEANQAIAQFNAKNPTRIITVPQRWQSVRQREKRIREAQDGVYLPRNRRDALEAGGFAFGNG